jgi:hypothetical protein
MLPAAEADWKMAARLPSSARPRQSPPEGIDARIYQRAYTTSREPRDRRCSTVSTSSIYGARRRGNGRVRGGFEQADAGRTSQYMLDMLSSGAQEAEGVDVAGVFGASAGKDEDGPEELAIEIERRPNGGDTSRTRSAATATVGT